MNERKELVTVPKRTEETEPTPKSSSRSPTKRRGHLSLRISKRSSPRKSHNTNRTNSPLSAVAKRNIELQTQNPLLHSVAVDLGQRVEARVKNINLNIFQNAKAAISKRVQEKLTDQVLDINIRRMRAQIVKREQYETEKALAAKNQ